MILTPIAPERFSEVIATMASSLDGHAHAALLRIANTARHAPQFLADLNAGRAKAIALAARLGIPTIDEEPARAFSWDGRAVRTRSETSVVFHEIAHWQIAPAHRRAILDFGLGAGPETGRAAEADAATCVDAATREDEENLASLLGILWETEHDEPAALALAEQNWLELYDRAHTARHFAAYLDRLIGRGLIDPRTASPIAPCP
jgi:hypothetical protein